MLFNCSVMFIVNDDLMHTHIYTIKPVRYVIHHSLPKSLTNYYQVDNVYIVLSIYYSIFHLYIMILNSGALCSLIWLIKHQCSATVTSTNFTFFIVILTLIMFNMCRNLAAQDVMANPHNAFCISVSKTARN